MVQDFVHNSTTMTTWQQQIEMPILWLSPPPETSLAASTTTKARVKRGAPARVFKPTKNCGWPFCPSQICGESYMNWSAIMEQHVITWRDNWYLGWPQAAATWGLPMCGGKRTERNGKVHGTHRCWSCFDTLDGDLILHYLGCINPVYTLHKQWDNLPINWLARL